MKKLTLTLFTLFSGAASLALAWVTASSIYAAIPNTWAFYWASMAFLLSLGFYAAILSGITTAIGVWLCSQFEKTPATESHPTDINH